MRLVGSCCLVEIAVVVELVLGVYVVVLVTGINILIHGDQVIFLLVLDKVFPCHP